MIGFLITAIDFICRLLILVVIIDAVLSFFMSPYSSVRMALDRIVGPLLAPIRKVVPPIGMVDISPIILLILIQIVDSVLTSLLSRLY